MSDHDDFANGQTAASAPGVGAIPPFAARAMPPFGSVVVPIPDDPDFAPLPLFKPSPPAGPTFFAAPPEPWFYRWIDGIAAFIWWSALATLGLAILVVALVLVLTSLNRGEVNPWGIAAAGYFIVSAVLGLLPAALLSALLRLAVDAARHLRAIRYR